MVSWDAIFVLYGSCILVKLIALYTSLFFKHRKMVMLFNITWTLIKRCDIQWYYFLCCERSVSRCMSPLSPTVSWFPMKVVVSCVLPTEGHMSSDGPAAAMETDALLLQVLGCGTVCQLIWDKLTLTLNSLNSSLRHFCSCVESAAHCGYCQIAPSK